MSIKLAAENLTTDTEAAMADIRARVPEMEPVAKAFAELAEVQEGLSIDTSDWSGECTFDADSFSRGEPLWAGRDLTGLDRCFVGASEDLLPLIERVFPHIASDAARLQAALAEQPKLGSQLLEASLKEKGETLDAISGDVGISVSSLSFLVVETLRPCLRRAAKRLAHLVDDELWCRSYCPICGAGPDFGFLKEKPDASEFLVSKAGRLYLHCSLCGSVWRFVRLVCPSCGQTDQEQLEVLTTRDRKRERIHVCRSCSHYLLVIDLMERGEKLHAVLSPLGLTPLDILAQERGYVPLAVTPWNHSPEVVPWP